MGDFADKLFWVVKRHSNNSSSFSIEDANSALDRISQINAENKSKDEEFVRLVKKLDPTELKWMTRTILKDLKLGMGQRKVFEGN